MNKKGKINLIIGIVVIFVLLLAGLFLTSQRGAEVTSPIQVPNEIANEPVTTNQTEEAQPKPIEIQTNTATLEINGSKITTAIEKNTSVYDFMVKLKTEKKITFTDKTYIGLGKFIDAINGVSNDGSRFWIYYVDGQKANIGISNYKINPGDVVSWKYEKDIN